MMYTAGLVILGIIAGTLSGFLGIGGGVIIVLALVYLFGFSTHQAQGTTIALLVLPIGVLGAWTYYRSGMVDFPAVFMIGSGFVIGAFAGARINLGLDELLMQRIFGIALLAIALK